jgi:hypothetical protein
MLIASDCAPSFPCGCAVSHWLLLCACDAVVGAGDAGTAATAIVHRQLHELWCKTRTNSPAGTRTSETWYEELACGELPFSFSHVLTFIGFLSDFPISWLAINHNRNHDCWSAIRNWHGQSDTKRSQTPKVHKRHGLQKWFIRFLQFYGFRLLERFFLM